MSTRTGLAPSFTRHALQRAVEMDVSPKEIQEALHNPRRVYPSNSDKYPGCDIQCAGRIALAIDRDRRVVITVIFDTPDGYQRPEMGRREEIRQEREPAPFRSRRQV